MVKFSWSCCEIVISNCSSHWSNVIHVSCEFSLTRFLYVVFIMRNPSTKKELFIFVDDKCAVSHTNGFSDWPQPDTIQFFKCFCMKLSLNAQLPKFVASHHEEISVGVNCCDMTVSTWNIYYILTWHYCWLGLLENRTSFIQNISPDIDYFNKILHLPEAVRAA